MKLAFALVSCLVLLLSGAAGRRSAQTPANVTVNIIHDSARACCG